jgi:hypothetical protein
MIDTVARFRWRMWPQPASRRATACSMWVAVPAP